MSDKSDFAVYLATTEALKTAQAIFAAGDVRVRQEQNRAGVGRILLEEHPDALLDFSDVTGSPLYKYYEAQEIELRTLLRFRLPLHDGLSILFQWINREFEMHCLVFVDDETVFLQRRGVLLLHSRFDQHLVYLKMLDRPFILKTRIE